MTEPRFAHLWKVSGPLPVVGLLMTAAVLVLTFARQCGVPVGTLRPTLADLKPVHAGVSVDGQRVSRLRRVSLSERVATDADGRARMRLDDGTELVIDRDTRLAPTANGVALEAGRLHVVSPVGAHSELEVGELSVQMSGASAGVERRGGKLSVYASDGELTVRAFGKEARVAPGSTAKIADSKLSVSPERAYDDWTHGLSRPWAARGAPRRAIGELWGSEVDSGPGAAGSPLTIRSQRVKASVEREFARTVSQTTFFNGGSARVEGDFRFALPAGALVSGFSLTRNGSSEVGHIALAARDATLSPERSVLEWAGDGWLRGTLPAIEPGQELTLSVEYGEWLTFERHGNNSLVQYRYPLVGESKAPLLGEFSARIDAQRSSPLALGAGYGARNDGQAALVSRSDFRPSADLVVDVEQRRISDRARLYVAPPDSAHPESGSSVLLRCELRAAEASDGVTLALVVDSSGSIDTALLDAERSLVEALLTGLGARDRVLVIAADQSTHAVGPKTIGPLDAARHAEISRELNALSPGGASDLGRALEAASDALPTDAAGAMVVYVGDGWPTLGDNGVDAIRQRLARRSSGAPRLAAVAVGPLANRRLLAALTRGSGPLFEIADGAEAAQVANELMSDALRPALSGVEVDLGPEIEQVYPRGARSLSLGDTISVSGKMLGDPPSTVKLHYRDARGVHEEVRAVEVLRAPEPGDVRRRWARERVEAAILAGQGREVATDVALSAGLITPWTALKLSAGEQYAASQLETRVLDLSPDGIDVVGPALASVSSYSGSIAGEEVSPGNVESLEESLRAAVVRQLGSSGPLVRACRDSRAALRPELSGGLFVSLSVDGDGLPHDVKVHGVDPASQDAPLERCVELALAALRFPATSLPGRVSIEYQLQLLRARESLGPRKCSEVSLLAMPLRRGAWWQRLAKLDPADVYRDAKQRCELPTWSDRRALLELMLTRVTDVEARVNMLLRLEAFGETDAGALVRREMLRRVTTAEELARVQRHLLDGEVYPAQLFEQRYRAANNDRDRLAVVARFLALAPHDSRLRRYQLSLLASLGKKTELLELSRLLRADAFADAELLCEAARTLRRAGFDDEARRTFGELAERAPRDPWVRALLGDRLRAEGWFDEASAAYEVLNELVPDDARASIRAALAHAGAGRLDLAERILLRVAQTGGRAADAGLSEIARELGRALAGEALAKATPGEESAALRRQALEFSQSDVDRVLLLRADPGAPNVKLSLERGALATKQVLAPDVSLQSVGLYLYRLANGASGDGYQLSASRPSLLGPALPSELRVDVLTRVKGEPAQVRTARYALPADGKALSFVP